MSDIKDNRDPVFKVACGKVAAALISVGIPYASTPIIVRKVGGKEYREYYFKSHNREKDMFTEKLVSAAKDPYGWVANNPEHPFSFALIGILNYEKQEEAANDKRALISFSLSPKKTIHIFEGSRRHQIILKKMKTNPNIKQL